MSDVLSQITRRSDEAEAVAAASAAAPAARAVGEEARRADEKGEDEDDEYAEDEEKDEEERGEAKEETKGSESEKEGKTAVEKIASPSTRKSGARRQLAGSCPFIYHLVCKHARGLSQREIEREREEPRVSPPKRSQNVHRSA
jgi:hypothetical protein